MRPLLYDAVGQPTHWAHETDQYRVDKPAPPRVVDPVTFHPHPLDPRYGPQPFPVLQPASHVTTQAPPPIVLLSRTDTDEERIQVRRARAAQRLGGGPLVRNRPLDLDDLTRLMVHGVHKRPVL